MERITSLYSTFSLSLYFFHLLANLPPHSESSFVVVVVITLLPSVLAQVVFFCGHSSNNEHNILINCMISGSVPEAEDLHSPSDQRQSPLQ